MGIFKNKLLVKLIASLCIFLTLLNFGVTKHIYASEDDEDVYGGVLIKPIMQLLTGIADGIMDILHSSVLEQTETLIRIDGEADNWWTRHGAKVLGWMAAIVVVAVVVVATVASGGVAAVAGAGIMAKIAGACFVVKTIGLTGLAAGTTGILVARFVDSAIMSKDLYLPVFKLTPEEIFANRIAMFDVNFFNPNSYTKKGEITTTETKEISEQKTIFKNTHNESGGPDWTNLKATLDNKIDKMYLNDKTGQKFEKREDIEAVDWANYGRWFCIFERYK